MNWFLTAVRIMLALALMSAASFAQVPPAADYPARPVKLIVGYPAGGGSDTQARTLAQRLAALLGQPVIVENRAGAGSSIAAQALANAPADGHTLYFADSAILAAPSVYASVGYDPLRSFVPVASVSIVPYTIAVHPSLPAANVKELVALLKAQPGKYSYGSPGFGNIAQLSAEMFKHAAGVDMVHVPYKGGAPLLADLTAGQIQIGFASTSPVIPFSRSGKLRLLAVTTLQRIKTLPDVPAVSETLPGFQSVTTQFVLAPAGTPEGIVNRLNAAIQAIVTTPEMENFFSAQGAVVSTGSPAQLGTLMRSEVATWAAVARRLGAKAE